MWIRNVIKEKILVAITYHLYLTNPKLLFSILFASSFIIYLIFIFIGVRMLLLLAFCR